MQGKREKPFFLFCAGIKFLQYVAGAEASGSSLKLHRWSKVLRILLFIFRCLFVANERKVFRSLNANTRGPVIDYPARSMVFRDLYNWLMGSSRIAEIDTEASQIDTATSDQFPWQFR